MEQVLRNKRALEEEEEASRLRKRQRESIIDELVGYREISVCFLHICDHFMFMWDHIVIMVVDFWTCFSCYFMV